MSKTSSTRTNPKYQFGLFVTPGSNTDFSSAGNDLRSSSSRTGQGSSSRQRTPRSSTPGTGQTSNSALRSNSDSSCIISIVEGRGHARGQVGVATIDLKRPVLQLYQFSDSHNYVKMITLLECVRPLEIVMPNTIVEAGAASKLLVSVSEYPHAVVSSVPRRYFNDRDGLEAIRRLCLPECRTLTAEVADKYYCLASAAALLKYAEFIQNVVFASESVQLVYSGSDKTTMIDSKTVRHFELTENARDSRNAQSLFGVMNATKTYGGARLLRGNILQPPCDLETIIARQESVEELSSSKELFYSVQSSMSRLIDIDHLIQMVATVARQESVGVAEKKITQVIYLKHVIDLIKPLRTTLETTKSSLLRAVFTTLEDKRFATIMELILEVIQPEAHYQKGSLNMRTQKCFAVKTGINGLLDVARRTYTEVVDDIDDLVRQLASTASLPLKANYSAARGFFIQLTTAKNKAPPSVDELPSEFIKVTRCRRTISFTTADLIKLNNRVSETLHEIFALANIVITELLGKIRPHIGCLYSLSEAADLLDMLLAFAHTVTVTDCVRPEFGQTLAVKDGRHPILDRIASDPPVANDIYSSADCNFNLISGPNMSGKSTYIKTVLLLQVLAQIGAFVPATFARFRVARQIFSRVGCDDDIQNNSSTFQIEMTEVAYILQNLADDSLVICDELGRGTSPEEGVGICWAVADHLASSGAFTFFATHYRQLNQLAHQLPSVECNHFDNETDDNDGRLSFSHRLIRGPLTRRRYGLELAGVGTLPPSLLERAAQFASVIGGGTTVVDEERDENEGAVLRLAQRIMKVANCDDLEPTAKQDELRRLRDEYLASKRTDDDTES